MLSHVSRSAVPPFSVGDMGDLGGLRWRIAKGRKQSKAGTHADDMVLEVTSDHWCRIPMSVGCLISDFHYQVEDILYPRESGYLGGEYFLGAVAEACRISGWQAVANRIKRERAGGQQPSSYRYQRLAPHEGREDEGEFIGRIRTRVTHALWNQGISPSHLLGLLMAIASDYMDELETR